jgi:acetyl-CoA carboxylase biotin carboxyl carrier protein
MTLDEIRELIKLATETGVAELEVQRGEHRVRIRRSQDVLSQEYVIPAAGRPAPATRGTGNPAPAALPASEEHQAEAGLDPSLVLVKSPIVGTFYEAPSPGAPPFVKPGDTVNPGQVLCIIESMKLMNEIEAEIAGVVVSKLVDNAQPVEYGEALFAVRPF